MAKIDTKIRKVGHRFHANIYRQPARNPGPCCECGEDAAYIFGAQYEDEYRVVFNVDQVLCSYKCWRACHPA